MRSLTRTGSRNGDSHRYWLIEYAVWVINVHRLMRRDQLPLMYYHRWPFAGTLKQED